MKKNNVILNAAKNIFLFAVIAGVTGNLLVACQDDLTVSANTGDQIDESSLDSAPALTLRSPKSADGVVNVLVTEGAGFASELIYATSNRPAELPQTIVLEADTTLVAAYRAKSKIDYKVLPEAFYKFDESRIITLDQDATTSASTLLKIYATNAVGNQLEAGQYLLPVVAKATSQNVSTTLYYSVFVIEPFEGDASLYDGADAYTVFYINTNTYDPRLVTDFYLTKQPLSSIENVYYNAIGNIINLRSVTITTDAYFDRAILDLGTDIRYVLEHAYKYIAPLQETGRKVCISIEGANKGIGFCNLTDAQIRDFSLQVKQVIDYYGLDGVNLWDRISGYDLPGAEPTNTTSYPKLIKNLRETLGSDKLLTLTDYETPTEYFWDVDATGGIQVGEYIDYAWSGYNRYEEGIQVIDPYHQDCPYVSTMHPRKPIAGLKAEKYACINAPWDNMSYGGDEAVEKVLMWVLEGYNCNKICVYEDLRTNLQDRLEGKWSPADLIMMYNWAQSDSYIYGVDDHRLWQGTASGYNKWFKDW